MKHRVLLPGLLALVLLFAACSPPPPLRDDTLLQDTSLTTENADCAAPCWRGITPGVTPWRDALTILEDDATLENVTVQEDEESAVKVAEFQQKGGSACCQMFTDEAGENVKVIFLRVAPTTSLEELFTMQGEPTYLVGSEYADDQAVVNLIYPDKALVIYAFVAGTQAALSETSEVVGILYMTPEDMDLLLKTNNLHAWEGYDTYLAYQESAFEVTPSVTLTPTATGE